MPQAYWVLHQADFAFTASPRPLRRQRNATLRATGARATAARQVIFRISGGSSAHAFSDNENYAEICCEIMA